MGRGKSQPLSSAIATDQLATKQPIYMLCGRLARSQGERLQQEGPPRAAWCGDAAGGLAAQNVGQAGSSSLSFLPRNCPLLSDRPGSLPSPHSPPRAAQLLEMPPSHPMGRGGAGETETQQDIQVYSEQIPQQPRQQEPEQGRWVRDWGETGDRASRPSGTASPALPRRPGARGTRGMQPRGPERIGLASAAPLLRAESSPQLQPSAGLPAPPCSGTLLVR